MWNRNRKEVTLPKKVHYTFTIYSTKLPGKFVDGLYIRSMTKGFGSQQLAEKMVQAMFDSDSNISRVVVTDSLWIKEYNREPSQAEEEEV